MTAQIIPLRPKFPQNGWLGARVRAAIMRAQRPAEPEPRKKPKQHATSADMKRLHDHFAKGSKGSYIGKPNGKSARQEKDDLEEEDDGA